MNSLFYFCYFLDCATGISLNPDAWTGIHDIQTANAFWNALVDDQRIKSIRYGQAPCLLRIQAFDNITEIEILIKMMNDMKIALANHVNEDKKK